MEVGSGTAPLSARAATGRRKVRCLLASPTGANPLVQSTTPGLKTDKRSYIQADPSTQATSRKGVFAGGDIVTGSGTVIRAMAAGRRAVAINTYLSFPA